MQNLEKVAYARNCPDAGSLIEHTGRQDLFVEAHIDELETLLELAMLQDAVASNRSDRIYPVAFKNSLYRHFQAS